MKAVRPFLLMVGCAALVMAQGSPSVPNCQIAGTPNPHFETDLKAAIRGLSPADRRPFFKALRAKQRELQHRLQEVERGLQQAESLKHSLEQEQSPRVVLTQFGSQGTSGDFYMEGSVNKGRHGKDEAVMLVGFRLSTVEFFRSLGSGAKP